MACVGEEREGAGDDAGGDLPDHQGDDEAEGDSEQPPVGGA
jgi:hypothetical protein